MAYDDGRSRAYMAMTKHRSDCEHKGLLPLDIDMLDEALASGGVKTVEEWQEACDGEWERMKERDRAEARVRELERLLRERGET